MFANKVRVRSNWDLERLLPVSRMRRCSDGSHDVYSLFKEHVVELSTFKKKGPTSSTVGGNLAVIRKRTMFKTVRPTAASMV